MPAGRQWSVELGDRIIARSDDAVILFEPARYPVAYFPIGDIDESVLEPSDHESTHPDLGKTRWFNVAGRDGEPSRRAAWEHVDPPAQAAALRYDVGDARTAAWSYRAPFDEVARIADLVSFYPEKLAVTIDGEKLEEAPG